MFAIVSFISFSFISDLIIMISFLLLTLGVFLFVCFSFFKCLRCKVRLFIWEVSCYLRYDCVAINFPLRTAFAASHRFWVVVLSFSFVSRYFLISCLISSVISWLFSNVLFTLHVYVLFTHFSCNWYLVS